MGTPGSVGNASLLTLARGIYARLVSRIPAPARRFWWIAPLVALCVWTTLHRVEASADKACSNHDESITLLAAAGKQREFNPTADRAASGWVPAREMQRLHVADRGLEFGAVREGLIREDFHPPLYFWLFHAASVATGGPATPSLGVSVNIGLHILGLLALFFLTRLTTESNVLGLAAAYSWTAPRSSHNVTEIVRQYETLGATAVVAVLACVLFCRAKRVWRHVPLLILGYLLPLITQLQAFALLPLFALIPLGGLAVGTSRSENLLALRRALASTLAAAAALGAAYLVYPKGPNVFARKGPSELKRPLRESAYDRVLAPLNDALPDAWLAWEPELARWLVFATLAATLLVLLRALIPAFRRWTPTSRLDLAGLLPFLVVGGLVARHFVGYRSDRPVDGYYYAIVYPFLALAVAQLLALIPRVSTWTGVAITVAAAHSFGGMVEPSALFLCTTNPSASVIRLYDHVVIDSAQRGVVGPLLSSISPRARVMLLERPNAASRRALEQSLQSGERVGAVLLSGQRKSAILRVAEATGAKEVRPRPFALASALPESFVVLASRSKEPGVSKLIDANITGAHEPLVALVHSGVITNEQSGRTPKLRVPPGALGEHPEFRAAATTAKIGVAAGKAHLSTRNAETLLLVWDERTRGVRYIGDSRSPERFVRTLAVP